MPSYFILHQFTDCDLSQALREVSQLSLGRYDNPFEQKDFLEYKAQIQEKPALALALDELKHTSKLATQLLNLSISHVDWQHYGGLFVYHPGDYLAPHVDAGIHPKTGSRKVATICLYLTEAELCFWQGDSISTSSDPEVWLETPVTLRAGEAILFANHDQAWHSVRASSQPRVCLTLSYMAPGGFTHSRYQNKLTRAYFARRHGTQDTPELRALRIARASEQHHQEVYRTC